jgi:hypothetical protein
VLLAAVTLLLASIDHDAIPFLALLGDRKSVV